MKVSVVSEYLQNPSRGPILLPSKQIASSKLHTLHPVTFSAGFIRYSNGPEHNSHLPLDVNDSPDMQLRTDTFIFEIKLSESISDMWAACASVITSISCVEPGSAVTENSIPENIPEIAVPRRLPSMLLKNSESEEESTIENIILLGNRLGIMMYLSLSIE